jgi:hypothetical protein
MPGGFPPIEFLNEGIEADLLLQAVHAWRVGGHSASESDAQRQDSQRRHRSGKWNEYCLRVDRLLGGKPQVGAVWGKPGHGPGSQLIFRPSGA